MRTAQVKLLQLHDAQGHVLQHRRRWNALACGRRWGKTAFLVRLAAHHALSGRAVGWFAPNYKVLDDAWRSIGWMVKDMTRNANKTERRMDLSSGGVFEFWTLQDPDAGRSRRYHLAVVDEAGLVRGLADRWYEAIRPGLMDYEGAGWLAGTPKGRNFFATAYALGQDPETHDWASWRMPTWTNPAIRPEEIEAIRRAMPERSFRQEIEAEFLEDAGGVFLGARDCVDRGRVTARVIGGLPAIGIDLAKSEDFTVASVVTPDLVQQELHRWHRVPWGQTVERLVGIVTRWQPRRVVVDSTGVGDPIHEALAARLGHRTMVESFKFTANSKQQLVDNLALLIERGAVRLVDDPVQTEELVAYSYEPLPGGGVRSSAPAGMHDDTVMALALACWPFRERRAWLAGDVA